jgi:hypothetical protein
MVDILTMVLTDGLPAVEAACAEAIAPASTPPMLCSASWFGSAIPARPPRSLGRDHRSDSPLN